MTNERKALMVSRETHKAIKRLCVEEDKTVEELLNEHFVEKCPTCGGVNGEHEEVLVSPANNDGGFISDEVTALCPEAYEK